MFCLPLRSPSGRSLPWNAAAALADAGDLLLLPIKPGGVEHQHFNLQPGQDCRWIAFSYMPFFDHVASEFTQTEVSPLFKSQA